MHNLKRTVLPLNKCAVYRVFSDKVGEKWPPMVALCQPTKQ